MALTIYGLHGRPHDFAVTKVNAPLEECVFILDFTRPLERVRWFFGVWNRWVGLTGGLLVPVAHVAEKSPGFHIGVSRGEPYFTDIPRLWKEHRGVQRTPPVSPVGGFQIIGDFANHFPEDAQPPQ